MSTERMREAKACETHVSACGAPGCHTHGTRKAIQYADRCDACAAIVAAACVPVVTDEMVEIAATALRPYLGTTHEEIDVGDIVPALRLRGTVTKDGVRAALTAALEGNRG